MSNISHPFLLFTEVQAVELRQRLRNGPRSRIHLDYATNLCGQFVDSTSENYFDFRERKSDFWHNRQGNFEIPPRLLMLALTGWLAERPEFLETAAEAILTLIREDVVDHLGKYVSWRRDYGHDAGKYFKTVGLLYDLLYHVLDDDGRKTLVDHADETILIARENISNASRFIDNNRGSKFLVGLSVLGMAMEHAGGEQAELAATYADRCENWLEMGLRHAFGFDGAPFEGGSYASAHILYFATGAHIQAQSGRKDCRSDPRFARTADYYLHETVYSHGWTNNFNDCSEIDLPQFVYCAGVNYGRPACLWAWDRIGCNPDHPHAFIRKDRLPSDFDFSDAPWYLLWPDDLAPEAKPPSECGYPNSKHFRNRGLVSIRSGWMESDLHTSMMSGPQMRTAHRHSDQNHVTLYSLGELFLIDSGYSYTDPDTGESVSAAVPEAHNTILIDGEGQSYFRNYNGWPVGQVESFVTGTDHAYVLGSAREAYRLRGALNRADRHLHAVWKEGVPTYAVWLDDVEADGEQHRYTLLLHTAADNRFEWHDGRIIIHGKENLLDIHLVTSSPAEIHEESYAGHPRLHIDVEDTRTRFAMLLHPRRQDESEVEFESELNEDSVVATVRLGDKTARHEFDTGPRPELYTGESVCYVNGPAWE